MTIRRICAETYFDGERLNADGPFLVTVADGMIASIDRNTAAATQSDITTRFLMPGLVEAHAHLFLDGTELDPKARSAHLNADFSTMIMTARANLEKSTRAGVTLVRDAGDRYGVNHAIRDEIRRRQDAVIELRSAGLAIKRPKRYGGFMARDVDTAQDISTAIDEISQASDDIKIILTGIIDFASGSVKGEPQFSANELALIVSQAHERGRKTFAHCSGVNGLAVAVEAGVDSIEHGFFMTRDILRQMVDKEIAWVPTFSPVYFQWAWPDFSGWNDDTIANLKAILDAHWEHVGIAEELGVLLVAGSDAGSQGVDHGSGLIDELFHFLRAGVPMDEVLRSATSRPRKLWGMPPANIARGNRADMVLLDRSPFEAPEALRKSHLVVKGEACSRPSAAAAQRHSSTEIDLR